jgi:hypothetical protein
MIKTSTLSFYLVKLLSTFKEKNARKSIWLCRLWHRSQKIDSTWHTHAYNHKLINHSHDHHIKDKPRKTRKFVVRCVKE